MKEITVKQYSELKGCTLKTVYERIKKGVLPQRVKGGKKFIVIEDSEYFDLIQGESSFTNFHEVKDNEYKGKNIEDEFIEEGEIVNDLPATQKYNLISMENTTFERLIQNIKEITDARVESEKESRTKIESEYFEVKAENKKLIEDIQRVKIESIQWEAEYKIIQVKVKEIESKRDELGKMLDSSKKEVEQLFFDKKQLEEKLTKNMKLLAEKNNSLEEMRFNLAEKDKQLKNFSGYESKNDDLVRELNDTKLNLKEVKKENAELKDELKRKIDELEKVESNWFSRFFKS